MTIIQGLTQYLVASGLFEKTPEILKIESLPGETNEVFLVTTQQQRYVIKIPRPLAKSLIDRECEYHAGNLTARAGINLPYLYFDTNSGVNITLYLDHIFEKELIIKKSTALFKKVHQLPQRFFRDLNIFEILNSYIHRLKDRLPPALSELLSWQNYLESLRLEFSFMDIPSVPCHNDPMLTNFLLANNQLYLIDWEYAGNNDPCWDLASFALEAEISFEQEQIFLHDYYGEHLDSQIWRRFEVYKTLSNYLWSLWCVAMLEDLDDQDNPFYVNALRRYEKFKTNLI